MMIDKKRTLGFLAFCLITAAASYADHQCDREEAGGEDAGNGGEHRRGFCDEDLKGTYAYNFDGEFGTPFLTVPAIPPNAVGTPNLATLPNEFIEVGTLHSNGRGRIWGDGRSVINGTSPAVTVHYHCTYAINSNGTGTASCSRDIGVGTPVVINWFFGLGDSHETAFIEWLPSGVALDTFQFNSISGQAVR